MVAVYLNEQTGDALILQSFDEIEPSSEPESLESLIARARAAGTIILDKPDQLDQPHLKR